MSGPHDFEKSSQGQAGRAAIFVRGNVGGGHRPKLPTAGKVLVCIDLLRLPQVRIAA